ncbi:MAG: enoyl-CoA hydratase/isomerase family protein [Rhodospirillales bacterium]|nr:enoyl-CoA hydratase/isomerase family protein [Rhodospirillales bacterium]MBI2978210.1 enoyl-CoA hydratase/isomerase family protein [Rhodospirillales bacterium]
MTDTILVERVDDIAIVVLNRPHKLNAFTKSMWKRLGEVAGELAVDDALRCVVVRGAGDKAFSPGNDISEFENERSNAKQAEAYGRLMHGTIEALRAWLVPKVAMIKGVCVGGGLEVAGLCDIRICGESSRFGAPIAKLGLVMAYPEISCLNDLVGPQATYEILLEGRVFGADEALQKGLVSRVVPDAEVEAEAMATARRIADGAPLVHRWHRKFLARLADPTPLTTAEKREAFACYDTEDFRIGYKAFLDKKKPEFKGK